MFTLLGIYVFRVRLKVRNTQYEIRNTQYAKNIVNVNKDASKAGSRSFRYERYFSRFSVGYSKTNKKPMAASRWQVSLAIPQGGILDLARLLNVNTSEDTLM